jgi:hypothetical protein
MLCASDVGCQDSQRVDGVALDTLDGTPVQSLRGQASDQVANLAAQVLNAMQVVFQL